MSAPLITPRLEPSETNPLIQKTATETFLSCANQLIYIAQLLYQHCGLNPTAYTLANRIEDMPRLLISLSSPITLTQYNVLRHSIGRLRNIRSMFQLEGGLEDYSMKIHEILIAIEYEVDKVFYLKE